MVKAIQVASDGFLIGRRAESASDSPHRDPAFVPAGRVAGRVEALQEDALL
jgi:hypothetical protein